MEAKICQIIRAHPEYRDILKNALKIEEVPPNDFAREYGWEWHEVKGHPGRLTKLVGEGIVRVTYKSHRYMHYKLSDREAVRNALKTCPL